MDIFTIEERDIDSLSEGSILEVARRVGVLLEEEKHFPDLVRVRLKRSRR